MGQPVEPPPSVWEFPDARVAGRDDVVAAGADLAPGTILAAYRHGIFPMPAEDVLLWWSPPRRGILGLDALRVSKSLRRASRDYIVTVDADFAAVIRACADPSRDGAWIDPSITAAYEELNALGWAHSVEVWADGELAGGLYGVAIGGLFAGESMFHHRTDASKVALLALVDMLAADGRRERLLDVQWLTDHLASLGAVEIERDDYLRRLDRALRLPPPVLVPR